MSPPLPGRPPRLSVVMAVLDPHPVYFPLAIRSILEQTFEDFEFIIVEDPSPRSAREVLDRIGDGRVRHFLNPRRTSLVQQKNRALGEARASLVAIFDADDVAEPTRLEKQVEYMQAHPDVGLLGSQIRIIDEEGEPQGYRIFPTEHESILAALHRIVPFSHPSVMFRNEVVLAAGGYRETENCTAEDYDLWSRLALRGVRFANLPEPLISYRIHPGQMKTTYLRSTIRNILAIKKRYWKNRMDLRSRARMWGEQLLLWLPPQLVLKLLIWLQYRDQLTLDGYDEDLTRELVRNRALSTTQGMRLLNGRQ